MTGKSKIEWTEQTWNPIVGCSIVSPGCTNCYAMKMAARIEAMGNQPRYAGTTRKVKGNAIWTGKLAQAPESALLAPLRRKKPTVYFVNSMGDLFHEDCPDEWIDRVFAVMALCPQHTFQVLTKRAARMREYMTHSSVEDVYTLACRQDETLSDRWHWPLPNVWLGVSTERQQEADERIPLLLRTPAAVRFISAEPLLGPVDLNVLPVPDDSAGRYAGHGYKFSALQREDDLKLFNAPAHLNWVIVGGESGPDARPMHPDWARSLRDQCDHAGVPFFFKQHGNWIDWRQAGAGCWTNTTPRRAGYKGPVIGKLSRQGSDLFEGRSFPTIVTYGEDSTTFVHVGKKLAGRLLDGVEYNGMPEPRA